jgi:hypothetical protein
MAVLVVVFNLPEVVNAWGISLVLGGGLLFLREASGSRLLWMYSIAVLLMLGVVFTPSWPMARLIAENLFPWGPVIVLVSGMLVFGYLKHAINQSEEVRSHVIGVHLLYVAGLSLVLTSMVFSGLSKLVLIMVGVVVVMMLINRRLVNASTDRIKTIFNLLSVTVIYRFVWRIYRLSSQGVMFISRVLEGQSAVLWAVLLLAFLIAIFNQLGIGG